MTWIAVGIAGAGLLMSYSGQQKAGKAEAKRGQGLSQIAEFEAQQMEQNAITEIATSQRLAGEERRRADITESRALALAAASGGGASDPTVVKIISELAGEGSYRSAIALYEGEERARQMRIGAQARRIEGQYGLEGGLASSRAYQTMATGSLLTGAGKIAMTPTLFQKYGGSGPNATPITNTTNTAGTNADAGLTGLGDYA
jgi:hypothetical protein